MPAMGERLKLPADARELEVYHSIAEEDFPDERLAMLTKAEEHLRERIEASRDIGTVYLSERQLRLRDKEISLPDKSLLVLLYLANRSNPVPTDELSERMVTDTVETIREVGRLKRIFSQNGFGEGYFQSIGKYYLAPRIKVVPARNLLPDTEGPLLTTNKAARQSSLNHGLIIQLCKEGRYMQPGVHFVKRDGELGVLPQGLARLRVLSTERARGTKLYSAQMQEAINRKSPVKETPFQKAQRELVEVLADIVTKEEERGIVMLIELVRDAAPGSRYSLAPENIAVFLYSKGLVGATDREVARVEMLMPYIKSKVEQERGSLEFRERFKIFTLSFT